MARWKMPNTYGTAFLARIGYFNPSRRFWTDEDFPDANEVKKPIQGFVERHRASESLGNRYRRVTEQLDG